MGGVVGHSSELGAGPHIPPGANPATPVAGLVPAKPQFFNFDAQAVRVVGDASSPWFVAKDVCDALEIEWKGSHSMGPLDEDEKGSHIVYTLGGPQEMLTVNESGLYALIFRSRKPSARLFRRWVTGTVLPSIRRTGAYAAATSGIREIHLISRAALPMAATVEQAVGVVLAHSGRFPTDHAYVRGHDIARAAVYCNLFRDIMQDPEIPGQTAAFMRLLVRFHGKWVPVGSGQVFWACMTPDRKGRHRRYNIQMMHQDSMPRQLEEKGGAA